MLLCTEVDLMTIQYKVKKQDIIEVSQGFVHIFDALLKNVPMGCLDSVISEPILKNNQVNYLASDQNTKQPYNKNLSLFRAIAVHLLGTTSHGASNAKIFFVFLEKLVSDPKHFPGVSMDNLPIIEDVVEKNIFIYDINIEELISKFQHASATMQKLNQKHIPQKR